MARGGAAGGRRKLVTRDCVEWTPRLRCGTWLTYTSDFDLISCWWPTGAGVG